jgi:PAS domain S-box-containing protein
MIDQAMPAELHRTIVLLRTIIEATPSPVYAKDREGRLLIANAAALELIGKPWAEVQNRTDREFLDDQAQGEAIMANDEQVMASGETYTVEEWVGAGNTAPRLFLSTKSPLRDETGAIIGIFGISVDITDRKKAEAAAIESEARSRRLNEALEQEIAKGRTDRERLDLALNASGIIGVWDGDLVEGLVYGDENFSRLYGVDPVETARGKPLGYYFDSMHPDDVAGARAERDRMLAGAEEYMHEHRIIRPDGSILWVLARGRLIRDRDRKPVRFVGASVDITERKWAETNQAFLIQLQDIMRGLTEPQAILDAAAAHLGAYLGANRIGFSHMQQDGETIVVVCGYTNGVPPVNGSFKLADFGDRNATLARQGLTLVYDDVLADPDRDTDIWNDTGTRALISVPLVRDGQYKGSFYVSYTTPRKWAAADISLIEDVAARLWDAAERGRAETKLRESEERVRLALESGGFGSWEYHVATGVTIRSRRHDQIYGYEEGIEDTHFQRFLDQVLPEDRPRLETGLRHTLETGTDWNGDYRIRHLDGSQRWIELHARRQTGKDGEVMRLVGTIADVTGRKAIEAAAAENARALAELNETLQEQVQHRTTALMAAEESLRQSQKMEAVGQLTGGIAHDFNNLLAAISGSLEFMELRIKQGCPAELDRYLDIAQAASKRAAALTHRLLAFSRRQTLDPKPTDMGCLITDMGDLIRRTVGPAVRVEVANDTANIWPTLVDPNQLENALLNLCINARDAMPDGGKITIETANKDFDEQMAHENDLPPGQYVLLCVSDTGTGMPAHVIERAFDPFFTTKPLGEGTGLGLSMVYGFVRQSGGQAKIDSEVGMGTRVYLYLPRFVGEPTNTETLPTSLNPHHAVNGETVLVVDDEPTIRMLVTEVLEELGYASHEASDGTAACKILEMNCRIDLLVTDVGLPGGMNGRQLAEAALRARPDLKILFITGYAENSLLSDGRLNPGMHIVTKPFSLEDLSQRIKEIMHPAALSDFQLQDTSQ